MWGVWGLGTCLAFAFVVQDAPTETPVQPAPYTEAQIARTIARIGYIQSGLVVQFGLKHLEQILKKMDLSDREDLKASLVQVMSVDPAVYNTIGFNLRKSAGEWLGKAKLVDRASMEISALLRGKETEPSEVASVEYAKATNKTPPTPIIDALKEIKKNRVLYQIAFESSNPELIHYLVSVALTENTYDLIYGLRSDEAALEMVKHYKLRVVSPEAPTDLAATLTTPTSVQLSWKDNSLNESGFIIERAEGDGAAKEIAKLPSNQIYYSDSPINQGSTYTYKVKSYNVSKEMKDPAITTIAVPMPPQDPPANPNPEPTPNPGPTPDPNPAPSPGPPSRAPVVAPPPLPASPPPDLGFVELTKLIRIEVGGETHRDVAEVLVSMLKNPVAPVEVAIEIGKLVDKQFTREMFDKNSLGTSLGLNLMDAIKWRADYEATNMSYDEVLRRDHAQKLNQSRGSLEKRLTGDLEVTIPPPTTPATNPSGPKP